MEQFMDRIGDAISPIAQKMTANRYLSAIKEGFFGSTPILIAGSIFLLFTSLPFNGYSDWLAANSMINDFFYLPYQVSFKLLSFFVVVGMARSLANYYKVDSKLAIALSLAGIFLLTPILVTEDGIKGLPLDNFAAQGLFVCMIATAISVEIYRFCVQKGITIKMPDSVPQNVSNAFAAVIPALFILLIFNVLRLAFSLTSFGNAQTFIFSILQQPLQSLGGSLPATILVLFIEAVIWCFGIHGSSIVSSVMNPIWYALSAENLAAFEAGTALPHIVNYQFISFFVKLGGVGATLSLTLLCLFKTKSNQYKALGKLGIWSSLFNINEPIIFGFPIVLNPMMMIPFVLSNVIVGVLTYGAIAFGLVPYINGMNLPYTIPAVISGFMICGWRGAVLQIVLLIVTGLIYYPFFKAQDKQACLEEEQRKALEK
ncbi:MAG TPA: PTS sugar transporter subunit IIC [Candidatus Massiliomicrobiota merdigallinarum]|nr:PTS sugar transporter subunit IIC [Candidatus Massilimicrobiota merdigallinarum]